MKYSPRDSSSPDILFTHNNAKFLKHRNVQRRLPQGSWDSHMHVIDPENYPLAADALYVPQTHLLEQALEREGRLGIDNIVLVQPSIYGNDNSCLLDSLRRLGPNRSRGVVTFDPSSIDLGTLRCWHQLGVRGVRVNFQSIGKKGDEGGLEVLLRSYANLIRPLDWVLQLYIPLSTITIMEDIIPRLNIRVCFDHFGHPPMTELSTAQQTDPYLIPGFASLVRLLELGNTYVKISAPYRFCNNLEMLETMSKILFSGPRAKRVVFGTDWPHTRYTGIDIAPFIQLILDWCGNDKALVDRVFKGNAMELWNIM